MIPTFLGMLILLGTLFLIGLGLVVTIAGAIVRRAGVVRVGAVLAGVALAGWGLAWVVGYVGAPSGVLPIGEELSFCGLDCHLHVSVVDVERSGELRVRLRFRNDARREPEYPFHLAFAVRDAEGRLLPPSGEIEPEALAAGKSIERELHFAVPSNAPAPTLTVRYAGWLDYLVPGRGNALVQGRLRLALGGPPPQG